MKINLPKKFSFYLPNQYIIDKYGIKEIPLIPIDTSLLLSKSVLKAWENTVLAYLQWYFKELLVDNDMISVNLNLVEIENRDLKLYLLDQGYFTEKNKNRRNFGDELVDIIKSGIIGGDLHTNFESDIYKYKISIKDLVVRSDELDKIGAGKLTFVLHISEKLFKSIHFNIAIHDRELEGSYSLGLGPRFPGHIDTVIRSIVDSLVPDLDKEQLRPFKLIGDCCTTGNLKTKSKLIPGKIYVRTVVSKFDYSYTPNSTVRNDSALLYLGRLKESISTVFNYNKYSQSDLSNFSSLLREIRALFKIGRSGNTSGGRIFSFLAFNKTQACPLFEKGSRLFIEVDLCNLRKKNSPESIIMEEIVKEGIESKLVLNSNDSMGRYKYVELNHPELPEYLFKPQSDDKIDLHAIVNNLLRKTGSIDDIINSPLLSLSILVGDVDNEIVKEVASGVIRAADDNYGIVSPNLKTALDHYKICL